MTHGNTSARLRLSRRGTLLLAVVAMSGLWVTTACAATTPPSSTGSTVSAMNGWSLEQLPAAQVNPQLATMEANGVQVVRSDAPWYMIEPHVPGPQGPVWQTWQVDNWVTELAEHGMAWQPIVDYSAPWATSPTCPTTCPPTSDAQYAQFAQFVASRWGAGGSFWTENPQVPYHPAQIFEIWNEEDGSYYWYPGPQPGAYAQLYQQARSAIKAVDPTAQVDIGGLSDSFKVPAGSKYDYAGTFVALMLMSDPGLAGHIDGIALHPYAANAQQTEQLAVAFRSELDELGMQNVPIDLTEFGWTTGSAAQESWRAQQMSTLAENLPRSDCGFGELAPYDWMNPLVLGEPGDWGFVDRTGLDTALRPAGISWFAGLKASAALPKLIWCGTTTTGTSSAAELKAVSVTHAAGKGTSPHKTSKHNAKRGRRHQSTRHRTARHRTARHRTARHRTARHRAKRA